MEKVKRVYPTVLLGFINYLEENYHEIDEFIGMIHFKDGTSQMCYDMYSYRNSLGSTEMMKENLFTLAQNDTFESKKGSDKNG